MKPTSQRKPRTPRATRANASEVAAGAKAPARLDREQRALVAEALLRAESARNVVEDALVGLGRWLLVHVFADDAAAALGQKRVNPVWRDLCARAGGPTLRLSRRMLYVCVTIAAHDKRITDDAWRLLEPGRKEILLPLRDASALREGAQHVVAMKLTHRDTRAYVRAVRKARGDADGSRATVPKLRAGVRHLRERVMTTAATRKLRQQLTELPAGDRKAVRDELVAMRAWLDRLLETSGK